MKLKKAVLIFAPLFVFLVVISINFFKPFGFFRESNPVMVCINANYWNSDPRLKQQRIPIESFTFNPNKSPKSQMWSTVSTFGYGWFLAPYYFFSLFNLSPNEISIRLFSCLCLSFTVVSIYFLARRLSRKMANNNTITYLTVVFYLFNASVLWYHVQGYVHEVAVLPLYFLSWLLYLEFIEKPSFKVLAALVICLFFSVQFDWLPCFQACVISIHLFVIQKQTKIKYAYFAPASGIALGIAWIVYTYSKWATLPLYLQFLREKFMTRTIGSGGLQLLPGLNYNFNLFLFYLSGYGLLLAVFLWGIRKHRSVVLWLIIFSAVLHHIVFWGFSTEHDHAVLKMAFPIAFIAAYVVSGFSKSKQVISTCLLVTTNIGIYFFLHNFYQRGGMYSNPNFCYEIGKTIKEKFNKSYQYVFVNTEGKHLLQIEFYAGKSYTRAASLEEAKQIKHSLFPNGMGYFIESEKGNGLKIVEFR